MSVVKPSRWWPLTEKVGGPLRRAARFWVTATAIVIAVTACGTRAAVFEALDDELVRVQGTGTGTPAAFYASAGVAAASALVRDQARPIDTITSPEGEFLQYSDIIVAIYDCATPAGDEMDDPTLRADGTSICPNSSGAAVHIDDYARGRARWSPIVASRWGTSADGARFRGGGGFGSSGGK